ncbi:MAG: hypothetical protein ABI131_02695 [Nostocoides sp.]
MAPDGQLRPDPTQWRLILATALAYAVGYPLALVGGSPIGWVLVALGGVLLMWLGVVMIKRIQRSGPSRPPEDKDTS